MSSDATRVVRSESVRVVYRQLPLALAATVLGALITAAVLAPAVGQAVVAAWLSVFALVIVVRFAVWWRFVRLPGPAMAAPRWSRAALVGSLALGLMWGVCPWLLIVPAPPYTLFVAFVIGGMCAGSVTVSATHLASAAAFVLSAVLPLAAWFATRGDHLGLMMALMTTLFAAVLVLTARRYAMEFAAGVGVRAALAERTAELAAANARLRAEIAEREEAEAALRQAQKMEALGSLTAGVAHEVNNVLMVVRGAADVLKRRLAYAPGHLRQVTAILRATERGATLTRRLLAFARKESLNPDVVDINAALRGIAPLLGATLGKSVRLLLELDETLPRVFVDRSGFEQAIINLAINARDAMTEGGTLTFRTALAHGTAAARDSVEVAVADSGTGMTESVRARAFDPFFTTKAAGQGSGLGLSQVYGLLSQSGGTVRISSAPGMGTTVLLHLPPADATQSPRPGLSDPTMTDAFAAEAEVGMRHIALLDDEDLVREVVTELLEGAGYRVSAFAQAADALRCVETDPSVALLVTDLGLPDVAGDEVARRARQLRPTLPVLFITGYNEIGQLADEPWQLRKPFGEADLLATVTRALRHRAATP